MQYTADRSISC